MNIYSLIPASRKGFAACIAAFSAAFCLRLYFSLGPYTGLGALYLWPIALLLVAGCVYLAILMLRGMKPDWILVFSVFALFILGGIIQTRFAFTSRWILYNVLIVRLLGIIAFIFAFEFGRRKSWFLWLFRHYYLLGLSIGGLCIGIGVFIAYEMAHGKAPRIANMQPWDIIKFILPVIIAGLLTDKSTELKSWRIRNYAVPLVILVSGVFLGVLFLKDFGQILIFFWMLIGMLYLASGKSIFPFMGAALSALAVVAALNLTSLFPSVFYTSLHRIQTWWALLGWNTAGTDLWVGWWADKKIQQLICAFFALHAGGWTGQGFGDGAPTLIPTCHNDYVYPALLEQGGWLLGIIILCLFAVIIVRGMVSAYQQKSLFFQLVVAGLTLMFAAQILINIGGTLALTPMTGISLPLLSASGFSLVTNMALLGLLCALEHNRAVSGDK